MIAGSMSPLRVPITAFQRVRPMEVSTHWPLRTAVTEPPLPVASDHVHFFYRLVQHLRGFLSHVEVAGAVCAVAANAVVAVQAVRQGVQVRFFRHGLVERGVEHGNVLVGRLGKDFSASAMPIR